MQGQEKRDTRGLGILYSAPMNLNEWVKAARQHAKLTQEQLGERLSLTKGNISGWENGRHQPSFDQVQRIAEITGYTMLGGDRVEYAGAAKQSRRIPVVGTAKMGGDGFFEEFSELPGAGDGHIEIATEDPNAYCLRVRGQSMFPAIRDGWYVLIEPNATPYEGEYVLIRLRDGRKMVKEFLFRRQETIEVMSVNGGERLSFTWQDLAEDRGMQAVGAVVSPSKWRPD